MHRHRPHQTSRRPFRRGLRRPLRARDRSDGRRRVRAKAARPERGAVLDYRDRVRAELAVAISYSASPCDGGAGRRDGGRARADAPGDPGVHAAGARPRPEDTPGALAGCGRRRTAPHAAGGGAGGRRPSSGPLHYCCPSAANEFPAHRVHVPACAIDEHPVTNADLVEFVEDGGYAEPGRGARPTGPGGRGGASGTHTPAPTAKASGCAACWRMSRSQRAAPCGRSAGPRPAGRVMRGGAGPGCRRKPSGIGRPAARRRTASGAGRG